jgi:hypothetical protein
VYSFSIILWELLHNELAWKRSGPQKAGINARLLVEMVAYRRARPPVKERLVEAHEAQANMAAAAAAAAAGSGSPVQLATDSARIHPQAFASSNAASVTGGRD